MTFNSITFVIFFVVVLGLHYLPFPWRVKKFNLLVASYLFYASFNPPFVVLLVISTVVDWVAARRMYHARSVIRKRIWMVVSLCSNLGMLGYFKYANFLMDALAELVDAVGLVYSPAQMSIFLPIGISFYTFQTLSYTIDVYRGNLKPAKSFLDFSMYVAFFPQLVAGPIVRAAEFLPQCEKTCRATADQMAWGLVLLTVGLFEKVVLADRLFLFQADHVYAQVGAASGLDAWLGTLAFAGQILCDFAGYSTCAIGVAMCLGFALSDNFRYPYAAIGFSDFWRRWHISLSAWLRDYLYVPLGGNRSGTRRTYINLMLTMLLGGLWHGASWRFVVWGGLHGVFLMVERWVRLWLARRTAQSQPALQTDAEPKYHALGQLGQLGRVGRVGRVGQLGRVFGIALTFIGVLVTWVFFRAESISDAVHLVAVMFDVSTFHVNLYDRMQVTKILTVMALIVGYHCYARNSTLEDIWGRMPRGVRVCALALMVAGIILLPGNRHGFIYFQF